MFNKMLCVIQGNIYLCTYIYIPYNIHYMAINNWTLLIFININKHIKYKFYISYLLKVIYKSYLSFRSY